MPIRFASLYGDFTKDHPLWNNIESAVGQTYDWPVSTYIAEPPFFEDFAMQVAETQPGGDIKNACALGIFGDSVTTDHISPAGAIKATSPAGEYLQANTTSNRLTSIVTARGAVIMK